MRQFQDRENRHAEQNRKEPAHQHLGAKNIAAEEVAETDRHQASEIDHRPHDGREIFFVKVKPLAARLADEVELVDRLVHQHLLAAVRGVICEHRGPELVGAHFSTFKSVVGHLRPFFFDHTVRVFEDGRIELRAHRFGESRTEFVEALQRRRFRKRIGVGVIEALPRGHNNEGKDQAVKCAQHSERHPRHFVVLLQAVQRNQPSYEAQTGDTATTERHDDEYDLTRRLHSRVGNSFLEIPPRRPAPSRANRLD